MQTANNKKNLFDNQEYQNFTGVGWYLIINFLLFRRTKLLVIRYLTSFNHNSAKDPWNVEDKRSWFFLEEYLNLFVPKKQYYLDMKDRCQSIQKCAFIPLKFSTSNLNINFMVLDNNKFMNISNSKKKQITVW